MQQNSATTPAFNTSIPARTAASASDAPATPKRQRAQGKRLLAALAAAGIEAHSAVRDRRTLVHAVKFVAPNLTAMDSPGTDPARVWAGRITAAFSDVEVVDTYDSVAEWREGQPVLFATVFVRVIGEKKSA